MAEDAKCISGTESGKQYGTRTDDKMHQTARGGKTIRRNASIERTRQKTQDSRKERSHLNYDIGGGEHRAEGTSHKELKEQIQSLMTSSQERGAASSAESSAEWQKLTGRKQ